MMPNFLMIGCSKAGTTSIHIYLGRHPDVFMSPIKEPGYFAFAGTDGRFPLLADHPFITRQEEYEHLFEGVRAESVIGESSTHYLEFASPRVVERIHTALPGVRILTVLRHPVDRAYSRFTMFLGSGRAGDREFREWFLDDLEMFHAPLLPERDQQHVVISTADRLVLYLDRFTAESTKVMLYDDLQADPAGFMVEIYDFLGVDPSFKPDTSIRRNTGGVYRSRVVEVLFNRPNPIRWLARRLLPASSRIEGRDRIREKLLSSAPKLDPALRSELTAGEVIQREIDDLEQLTGRDLSAWRSTSGD